MLDVTDELQFVSGFSYKQFQYKTLEYRRDCVFPNAALCPVATFPLDAANSEQTSIDSSVGAPDGADLAWVIPNIDIIADQIGLYTGAFPFVLQKAPITRSWKKTSADSRKPISTQISAPCRFAPRRVFASFKPRQNSGAFSAMCSLRWRISTRTFCRA